MFEREAPLAIAEGASNSHHRFHIVSANLPSPHIPDSFIYIQL